MGHLREVDGTLSEVEEETGCTLCGHPMVYRWDGSEWDHLQEHCLRCGEMVIVNCWPVEDGVPSPALRRAQETAGAADRRAAADALGEAILRHLGVLPPGASS
jgi:hypothetical protein